MDIVFLDQNKWIELAQVHSGRTTFSHHRLMAPLGYVPPAEFETN